MALIDQLRDWRSADKLRAARTTPNAGADTPPALGSGQRISGFLRQIPGAVAPSLTNTVSDTVGGAFDEVRDNGLPGAQGALARLIRGNLQIPLAAASDIGRLVSYPARKISDFATSVATGDTSPLYGDAQSSRPAATPTAGATPVPSAPALSSKPANAVPVGAPAATTESPASVTFRGKTTQYSAPQLASLAQRNTVESGNFVAQDLPLSRELSSARRNILNVADEQRANGNGIAAAANLRSLADSFRTGGGTFLGRTSEEATLQDLNNRIGGADRKELPALSNAIAALGGQIQNNRQAPLLAAQARSAEQTANQQDRLNTLQQQLLTEKDPKRLGQIVDSYYAITGKDKSKERFIPVRGAKQFNESGIQVGEGDPMVFDTHTMQFIQPPQARVATAADVRRAMEKWNVDEATALAHIKSQGIRVVN